MFARACLVAVGALLLLSARAAGAEAETPRDPDSTQRDPVHQVPPEPESPFRWGIPESPFPVLEEERKLFGFHLHFEFGGSDAPRRGPRVR